MSAKSRVPSPMHTWAFCPFGIGFSRNYVSIRHSVRCTKRQTRRADQFVTHTHTGPEARRAAPPGAPSRNDRPCCRSYVHGAPLAGARSPRKLHDVRCEGDRGHHSSSRRADASIGLELRKRTSCRLTICNLNTRSLGASCKVAAARAARTLSVRRRARCIKSPID